MDDEIVNEYRIKVTVKNNLILTAIEKAGYKNPAAFCREADMTPTALGNLISMKNPPLMVSGEFSIHAKKLMEVLCLAPTDLWTSEQLTLRLKRNSAERDVNLDGMRAALGMNADDALMLVAPSPEEAMEEKDMRSIIEEQLDSITPKEARVLRMRYGIGCAEHTLEETGKVLEVTKERIRQIEVKALRKLKYTPRALVLKQLTEHYKPDGIQKFNLEMEDSHCCTLQVKNPLVLSNHNLEQVLTAVRRGVRMLGLED
jgi:RNA polymerase sigma factor (sigma-70 family)